MGGVEPHFVLLPFLAQGHLIPMVDLARLLAKRGLTVTILLTPNNATRVDKIIRRAIASGLSINVAHLRFPWAEAGLPEGTESFELLPSLSYMFNFWEAVSLLRHEVEKYLQELKPTPTCFIFDLCYKWATNLALRLQIPGLVFYGAGCFTMLCNHILLTSKFVEAIPSDTELFVLPGLPDRIEINKMQLGGAMEALPPEWAKMWKEINNAEEGAFGIVSNTFQELEPEYIKEYSKVRGKKVWSIGPVSLCNKDDSDKAARGNKAAIDEVDCLKWLDAQEPSSVVYVCLGSLSAQSTSQLIELGLGLEASNRPFIWVIRTATDAFRKWLVEEKIVERNNGKGLLIQGWAPQVLILSHPSVGGFVTHCGWNSTLEGLAAGLPMITWPVNGDQFCNERFIVNIIKIGIRSGVEVPSLYGREESVGVQVKRDDVKVAIDKLMDGGEEGRERREKARRLGEIAKGVVEEGGSSYDNLTQLIQDVTNQGV